MVSIYRNYPFPPPSTPFSSQQFRKVVPNQYLWFGLGNGRICPFQWSVMDRATAWVIDSTFRLETYERVLVRMEPTHFKSWVIIANISIYLPRWSFIRVRIEEYDCIDFIYMMMHMWRCIWECLHHGKACPWRSNTEHEDGTRNITYHAILIIIIAIFSSLSSVVQFRDWCSTQTVWWYECKTLIARLPEFWARIILVALKIRSVASWLVPFLVGDQRKILGQSQRTNSLIVIPSGRTQLNALWSFDYYLCCCKIRIPNHFLQSHKIWGAGGKTEAPKYYHWPKEWWEIQHLTLYVSLKFYVTWNNKARTLISTMNLG